MVRPLVALARRVGDDDLTGMAAEMAYSFLFALLPLLLLSAAVLGMAGSVFGRHDILLEVVTLASPFLPAPIADMLQTGVFDLVTERAAAIALIGLLLALWGAASGMGALMKGLDRAYGVTRPALSWRREVRRLVATVVVPPLGLALLIVSALAHALTTGLGALMGVSEQVAALVAALQLPLTFAVVFTAMTIVYWKLPTPRQRYRDVLTGSLVAAVGWSLITQAFGLYIADADAYGAAYGVFGAAIAFLLWLYLVSLVTLIGAEVNALVAGSRRSVG